MQILATKKLAAVFARMAACLHRRKKHGDKTYKVHLDGYDQTDLITGKGPSKRHEVTYFAEGTLGAIRGSTTSNIASSTNLKAGSGVASNQTGRSWSTSAWIHSKVPG